MDTRKRPEEELDAMRAHVAALEGSLAETLAYGRRLEAAHDASFDSVALLRSVRDETGRIVDFRYVYVNPVALRFLKRSREAVIGSTLLTVVPGHLHHRDLFARFVHVVESGVADEIELEYVGDGIAGCFRNVAAKIDDGIVLYFHDVTEAKRQEEALRASELEYRRLAERYGGLVAALAEIVWTTDPHGKVDDVPGWRHVTGQLASEVRGYGWLDAIHPEDRPKVKRQLERGGVNGSPFAFEFRLRTASGAYRYMQGRAVPLKEPEGAIREWVGVCIDDDKRRRAENELRHREREFATLAEGVPDVIARFDRDLRVRYVNPAISAISHVPPPEWIGRRLEEVETPEAVARRWSDELSVVLALAQPRTFEFRTQRASGESLFLQARLVPEIDEVGSVRGVIAVLRDLTELDQKEAALRESESFLKLAEKSAGLGIWQGDFEKDVSRWSPELYRMYGRDPSFPPPRYDEWLSLIHEEDRPSVEEATRPVVHGEADTWRVQFRIRHPERGERWLLEAGERSSSRATGVTLDVTEQKQAEERLRQTAKMEAVRRLAGGLAHDFNNQLQVIRGFASIIGRDSGLADRSRGHLGEIAKAVDRIGSLTSQLLAFSRQQVLRFESVDLDAAVTQDEPLLERLMGTRGRIRLELGPDTKWVRVDRGQLLQILLDLTMNARDAMPSGGEMVIRTAARDVRAGELDRLAKAAVVPGRYAELSISDNGTGIAPELLKHVFEPFFTTKEVGRGTGLGLATVHGIVSQSRGYVWVTSARARGTTVTLLLPITREAPVTAPETRAESYAARGGRVLVVEDEDAVRRFLREALVTAGFEVFEARNGREALAQLEARGDAMDLVLSDVVMPVMGGPEMAKELTRVRPELPIIWMSGYTRETAFEAGALGKEVPFLQKPVSASALVDAVRASLASKRRPAGGPKKHAER